MASSRVMWLLALTALAGCGSRTASSTGTPPPDGGGGAMGAGAADSSAGSSSVAGAGGASGASSASDAGDAGGASGNSSDAGDAGGSSSLDAGGAGGSSSTDAGGAAGAGGTGGTGGSACTSSGAVTWSHAYDVASIMTSTQIASDSHDATLTSGRFYGTLDLGGATYTSPSSAYCDNFAPTDGFLLKLDANGGYVWSEDFTSGTWGGTTISDATFDPAGDALAVGTFSYSITIDGVTYTNPLPPCMGSGPPGGEGGFLVKRAGTDGAPAWSRGLTTPDGSVQPDFVVADPAGDVVVSGGYAGTFDAGGGTFACADPGDWFVAKYAGADGAPVWSRCIDTNYLLPTATDANGDVLLAAPVNGPVDFGAGPISTSEGLILVRYDGATGALKSTTTLATGEVVPHVIRRVGADLYAAGSVGSGVDFGAGPYTTAGEGVFVARFNVADGSLVWAKVFDGILFDQADSLTTDSCGLLVGGVFYNSIDFGLGPIVAPNVGSPNRFLLDLTTGGDTLSAARLGPTGSGDSAGYGLAPASDGGAFISGWTSRTIDLDGTTFAANTNMQKLFVARLAP